LPLRQGDADPGRCRQAAAGEVADQHADHDRYRQGAQLRALEQRLLRQPPRDQRQAEASRRPGNCGGR
jgi:hypothetical protein